MRRMLKWSAIIACLAFTAAGIAYATTPGYHRAVTPGLFGMQQVAPNLYIDDASSAASVLDLIAQAERVSEDFFGELRADPTYVVCTTQRCREDFALRPKGLSLGYQLILIAPTGIDPVIFAHERLHAELHSFMGLRDLVNPRFPSWFDEGLASHISQDPRLARPANPRDADWIKTAVTFRDWGRLHPKHHWTETYGAAATLVAELESQIGRDGLLRFIQEVADGKDFQAALNKLP